mgnify:CR=1 FL=1
MRILLYLLLAPLFVFAQGEQRYADGTATDQDGNTFEWINYGTQDWSIENAEVVTYRDGTEIPQVTDNGIWSNLTTGAWCYYDNDPTKGKLYNWYAAMGIHDTDPNTPNKEFAPEGWHVPTDAEWTELENYLIANVYNYDGTTTGNKIGKAITSTTGWNSSTNIGVPGNDQSSNNSSGFNAFPVGYRSTYGSFSNEGINALLWNSSEYYSNIARILELSNISMDLKRDVSDKRSAFSVRFIRDASTASTHDYSNAITIYPNPTTSIVTLQGGKEYDVEVYTLQGKKVMALTGNSINMGHLSTATYIVKATDKSNNEELTYKVVKN